MGLRICFVTPFAWSQPHEVNAHVEGTAAALRRLGHDVTVLAPSSRARDLLAGRRALQRGTDEEVIAVGPSIPISRRTNMGVPVAVRANLRLALSRGRYDVVHGFEPGLPSLSYLALTSTHALTAATFFSPDRLAYPPRRSRRDRLRARVDALLATSQATADAAAERFEGDYALVPIGVDTTLFRPGEKRQTIAVELEPAGRERDPRRRAAAPRPPRLGADAPPHEAARIPSCHPALGAQALARPSRAAARATRRGTRRGGDLRPRSRRRGPAGTGGCGLRSRNRGGRRRSRPRHARGLSDSPQTKSFATAPRLEAGSVPSARASISSRRSSTRSTRGCRGSAETAATAGRPSDPLADRDWIVVDLHMHTDWSHDCSIPVADLLDHAEEIGLGGIAITDHNAFGGALEAVELARGRELVVIPGEEVKTDGQGEVIGLFLEEEIPRGMSFGDTIEAIREQGGLVYLPHPFDRLHAIPDPATLHRHLAEIDVFEVFNARLLRDSFNDEALRFARKYRLLQGAGSDAHVLQGVGTGALRMRRFEGRGGVPALAPHGRGAAPSQVARVPAVAQVGGAGQGKGPVTEKVLRTPCQRPCPPTRSTSAT